MEFPFVIHPGAVLLPNLTPFCEIYIMEVPRNRNDPKLSSGHNSRRSLRICYPTLPENQPKTSSRVPAARINAICAAITQHVNSGSVRELGIAAPMGFGKSTAIVEWVVSNSGGCIVVVEFRDKAKLLAAEINELSLARLGKKICKVWYGISAESCQLLAEMGDETDKTRDDLFGGRLCKECPHTKCLAHPVRHDRTKKYPVLIITHARLRIVLRNNKAITKYTKWQEGQRRIMLIDERRFMVDDREISNNQLLDLQEEYGNSPWNKAAVAGLAYLSGVLDRQVEGRFPPRKQVLTIRAQADSPLKVVERLCNYGGFVAAKYQGRVLKLANYHPLNFKSIDKYVTFDGTLGIDPHYSDLSREVAAVHFARATEGKIRLHSWSDQKVKSGFIRAIQLYPERVKKLITAIRDRHPSKEILVITTKSRRPKIEKMLIPGVVVRHFGALKGNNDLREFGVVYFTHIFQHPPSSILSLALAGGYWPGNREYAKKKSASGRWGFTDLRMERIRVQHIISCLAQDIYRTRIRGPEGGQRDVDVYLGLVDPTIISGLSTYFPNIEIVPETFSLRKKGAVEKEGESVVQKT
jgi:hypothetical protein